MTKEELIKRLETTCFGLDPIDPLRLLVDDVIAALAQPQRTWVGLTDKEIDSYFEDHGWSLSEDYYPVIKDIEAKLKDKNN